MTDSGDFLFLSIGNAGQRPNHCIKLLVQEFVLTQPPTLTVLSITKGSNESCVVLMECRSEFDRNVSYVWTVKNVNYSGAVINYQLTPQEGEITFTCSVSNKISETAETKSIYCQSSDPQKFAALLLILLPLMAVCWYKKTAERRQSSVVENRLEDKTHWRMSDQQQKYSSLLQPRVDHNDKLKTTDSGDFTFVSAEKTGQRPTFCVKLVVQEVLTQPPIITITNVTKTSNESCMVLMECRSEFAKDVNYKWIVDNVNHNGSRLKYQLKPQDRYITFTCTVSNKVSEKSERRRVNCQSSIKQDEVNFSLSFVVLVVAPSLLILLPLMAMCCYKRSTDRCQNSNSQVNETQNVTVDNQQQLYSSLLHGDINVYENLRDSKNDDDEETSDYINIPGNVL
ncbi:hypothetical protein WMY93_014653 [Mugilogobius chulae]|uniref:Ig-like domain-containing protein n=1 Tax=Mugilogobius chulae TaxID=88201 RepID=A0AAW0NW08_9GOBI